MQPEAMMQMLKSLKLHGMAQALGELAAQDSPAYKAASLVLAGLLKAEMLSAIPEITIRAPVIGIFVDQQGNRYAYSADSFLSPRVRHHLLSGQTPIPSWPGITGE